jgi:hypothetical protein
MSMNYDQIDLTDLVDNPPTGPEWDAWLASHSELASEIDIARRVRAFVAELQNASINVPPDFEMRLMERVRADRTLLDLLDLGVGGCARAILELLNALLNLLPAPQTDAVLN